MLVLSEIVPKVIRGRKIVERRSKIVPLVYREGYKEGNYECSNMVPRVLRRAIMNAAIWLRVNEANDVPINSHICVGPSTFNRL